MGSSTENFIQILKNAGVKPSIQRIKIYDFLWNNRTHPTIDSIFQVLVNEIPTLSKTTVYNTMKLFMEHQLVRMVTIDESEVRFDVVTQFHGHFKCEVCGKLMDVEIENPVLVNQAKLDFEVSEAHYYLKGLCNECNNN